MRPGPLTATNVMPSTFFLASKEFRRYFRVQLIPYTRDWTS